MPWTCHARCGRPCALGTYSGRVRGADQGDGAGDAIDIAELTALALAVDPDDVEIDDDAEPFGVPDPDAGLLPSWYMPAPLTAARGTSRTSRAGIVVALVIALVAANGVGLCVTYGLPEVGDRLVPFW